ncbi:cyclopropane fatty-acyl-phospholipid synthase-like methyltransferase [Paenibacillus turicensis]|uniref:Cyclopropane fatty-acyl-phospholipid synthase-like methyltransferase n=1 Tax=Paenibacillus turicensis TaxID=160487 RepID=A0ABS4FV77_9BACL|nr:methyltransferase domain-containing protein [Paenibacillus turicensis]MBP1906486.1 cyclopropane fatty-acyl-phospholipid synthase-like methyltransferase [Paenibacillus turicensis]
MSNTLSQFYYDISKKDLNMMGPNTLMLLEELLTNLDMGKKGLRILDLGCGNGLNSLYFAKEQEATVFATDLWISASDNYNRFKSWGVEELIIPIHANANDLPFSNEYFDLLVCIDAYHYFGTGERFFEQKILSLIKPGGYVLIAIPGMKQQFEGQEPDLVKEWCGEEISNFLTVNQWAQLIGHSDSMESVQIEEMHTFEEAWQDWFDTQHEYAMRDQQFFNKGLNQYINFISIIVKKSEA